MRTGYPEGILKQCLTVPGWKQENQSSSGIQSNKGSMKTTFCCISNKNEQEKSWLAMD